MTISTPETSLFFMLDQRRRDLGMSVAVLARESGVSVATVQRMLSGRYEKAAWSNIHAVARTLGVTFQFQSAKDVEILREQQAQKKAKKILQLVQGTSALEAQAVGSKKMEEMLRRSVHELLAGPKHKLWAR